MEFSEFTKKKKKKNKKKKQENSNGPELAIDPNIWHEHFKKLNSVKSKFEERLEQLNQVLKNDKQTNTFSFMDTVIKDKEIQTSIAKLKNNKSSGLDSIRNEMIKAGATVLLPCLNKLFNLIFSSGYYSSSLAKGYITPIFKTGDNSDPDNYRGIIITSNIGKLFNMIFNSRLDKFLEDNQIINNVQIGFTKNARTSDQMFVLKSLIDKCINTNGGKLYSYFVGF